jgi:hypothetical protein
MTEVAGGVVTARTPVTMTRSEANATPVAVPPLLLPPVDPLLLPDEAPASIFAPPDELPEAPLPLPAGAPLPEPLPLPLPEPPAPLLLPELLPPVLPELLAAAALEEPATPPEPLDPSVPSTAPDDEEELADVPLDPPPFGPPGPPLVAPLQPKTPAPASSKTAPTRFLVARPSLMIIGSVSW